MKNINLNGTWKLYWSTLERGIRPGAARKCETLNPSRAFDATVPGSVHLDLMRAGIIDEPAEGLNALACRWVEECFWFYRRSFTAPALARNERAWLVFETLDLAAAIHLNGREVGRHANAFRPCRIDVTEYLRKGENQLVVEIESGLYRSSEKQSSKLESRSMLCKRPWLRKTQSSFEWDWAPRLLNVGITGNARLEITSMPRVETVALATDVDDRLATGTVHARAIIEGAASGDRKAVISVAIPGTGARVSRTVTVKQGIQKFELDLTVPKPELWWPVGHGHQHLYDAIISVTVAGKNVYSARKRVGFRKIRINQSPHPESGRYFIIEVNNKPVFAKGGNMVPADVILQRIDRTRYTALVDKALEANFNFLRIWGGGLYESDDFYELCDQKGIMVWQEFIFACARYPGNDEEFYHDVKQEAEYQVRRLSSHPSLVAWCGNNEIEMFYQNYGYDKGDIMPDYCLYHHLLPATVNSEDGTRFYQPSSPYSPDVQNPIRDDMGDQHPWSIGFGDNDFRKYRKMECRFPNEGGILGANGLATLRKCLPPGHEFPGSFAWGQHDNSVYFWDFAYEAPDMMLKDMLGKKLDKRSL